MEFRRFNDAYVVRMDRGEEVMESLTTLCEQEGIRLASVEAIGAVDRAVVGLYDVGEKVYHKKEFTEPMELTSLLGTVTEKDGKPYLHLHATLLHLVLQGFHGVGPEGFPLLHDGESGDVAVVGAQSRHCP